MMRKIILICFLVVITNFIISSILKSYDLFNCVASNLIFLLYVFIGYNLLNQYIKPAFKISISFFLFFGGILSFILSLVMPSKFENNLHLIIIVVILLVNLIIYIFSANSKKINKI
jgi:hypothetical protein